MTEKEIISRIDRLVLSAASYTPAGEFRPPVRQQLKALGRELDKLGRTPHGWEVRRANV